MAGSTQNISVKDSSPGGTQSALNISAAGVIKGGPGTIMRIITQVAGTGGSLVINDLLANSGAAAANQVATIPNASLTVTGVPVVLEFPCKNGIVVSAIPTGGWVGAISYF